MTSGIVGPWQNRPGSSGSRQMNAACGGPVGRRWAWISERRLVNWRPRSSMRHGAKSKHLERRQRVQVTEPPGRREAETQGKTYLARDRVYLDWNATTPLRPEAR